MGQNHVQKILPEKYQIDIDINLEREKHKMQANNLIIIYTIKFYVIK